MLRSLLLRRGIEKMYQRIYDLYYGLYNGIYGLYFFLVGLTKVCFIQCLLCSLQVSKAES